MRVQTLQKWATAPTCKTTCAHASSTRSLHALLLRSQSFVHANLTTALLTVKKIVRAPKALLLTATKLSKAAFERETLIASSGFTHLWVHLSPPPRIHTLKRATGGWLWRQWRTPLAISAGCCCRSASLHLQAQP